MLFNYIKIAFRSLLRNKIYSFINILGLSGGVAISLIIFLFVVHELNFDRFHQNSDRIYEMGAKVNYGGQVIQFTGMSAGMGPFLKANHPEVQNFVRIHKPGNAVLQSDDHHISKEPTLIFSDTSMFTVFNFPLIQGNFRALARPNTIVVTEAMAMKFFGSSDVLGKVLRYNQENDLEIVGVIRPTPSNSIFDFNCVVSFSTLATIPSQKENYGNLKADFGNYATYLLVDKPESLAIVSASLKSNALPGTQQEFFFKPLSDLHQTNTYLTLFIATALVILVLALINYMNLTTATATLRSREVGVRKVIGAGRRHLGAQFYLESAIVTTIAFALAFFWMEILLPVFLQLLAIRIDMAFLTSSLFMMVIGGMLVGCILLAGSYPAIVLSGFKPIEVLKGKTGSTGGVWIRKSFTVFQFAASICLLMVTLCIQSQLEFMRNRKIGLNKDQVMVFSLTTKNGSVYNSVKNDIRGLSGVREVAAASIPIFTQGNSAVFMKSPVTHEDVFMNILNVDQRFISTLGIEWIEKPDTLAKKGFILNEAALEKLKITKKDIGIELDLGSEEKFPFNGVVKNFNYQTSHGDAGALIFAVVSDTNTVIARRGASLYVKLETKANLRDNVAAITRIFEKYQTGQPFEYYFLDDAFEKLFQSEDRLAKIFDVFTGVAIALACLGLFGLITFSVEIRTKEIGIRKVLGANLKTIFVLLSRDFLVLIAVSVVIAVPLAVWYSNHWLTQFPHRINVQWWFGAVATAAAVTFALVTISAQVIRAALVNPVDSLRSE